MTLSIRAWLYIALAVSIAGIVGWSRWQVHRLESDLAKSQSEAEQLKGHIVLQNTQIESWKQEADSLQKAAETALKQATEQRQRADRLSATIYNVVLPKDECDAMRLVADTARSGWVQ